MSVTSIKYRPLQLLEILLLLAVVIGYGSAAYQRNIVWKDDLSLWADNAKKAPSKARVYQYLGLSYYKAGHVDEAILQYKKGLALDPYFVDLHNNIGVSYSDKGLVDEAIRHFKTAIALDPRHANAHYNLGVAYGNKGLFTLANEEMRKGMELEQP